MSVAPGTRPGQGGLSGTPVRKASRPILKSSSVHFMHLSSFGRTLKSFGLKMLKLSNLVLSLEKGTAHVLLLS